MYVFFRPRIKSDWWGTEINAQGEWAYRYGNGWPVAIVWKRLPVRKSPDKPIVARYYETDKGCQICPRYRPFVALPPCGELRKATPAQVAAIMGHTYPNGSDPISGPLLLRWLEYGDDTDESTCLDKSAYSAEYFALPSAVEIAPAPEPLTPQS